jgi:VWFA-related protein
MIVRLAALLMAGVVFQTPEAFQISVNVDLVVLQASVGDRSGHFPPDLSAADFAVYEDGVKQSIRLFRHEDIPVTVGLVIDHSGSMRSKLADVVAAARTFVESSNPADRMFVVNFNDRVATAMNGTSPFFNVREDIEHAILKVAPVGMTSLYDAVFQAQEQFRAAESGQPNGYKNVLIVISDGGDNASKHTLDAVLRNAESSPTVIYTIGLFDEYDTDKNIPVLKQLAHATGGEAFFPPHLAGTVEICGKIAHEIRNQYTLGFVSTNSALTGMVRKLRVTASASGQGKLVVRTRTGYIAEPK